MRFSIPFALAFASLSLAIPFPNKVKDLTFFTSRMNSILDKDLDLLVSDRQSGLNFSPCTSDSSCVGDRVCVTITGDSAVSCTTECICLPSDLTVESISCTTTSECDSGETCLPRGSRPFCVADELAAAQGEGDASDTPTTGDDDDVEADAVGDTEDDDTTDDGDSTPVSGGRGLTGEPCSSDEDCATPRLCVPFSGSVVCLTNSPDFCTASTDCVDGEVCVEADPRNFCFSRAVVGGDTPPTQAPSTTTEADSTEGPGTTAPSTTEVVSTSDTVTTSALESSTDVSASTSSDSKDDSTTPETEAEEGEAAPPSGLTLDPCQNSDECAGTRTCVDVEDGESCSGSDCRCLASLSTLACESDSQCDEGEGCFGFTDFEGIAFIPEDLEESKLCASRAARDAAVCIASHSLTHISREELVFEKHAVAHVLCDLNDSCATPGHMVRYKGSGMMMKSYCELTSCVRKVMRVNSPKYRKGLTIPSQTDDLVFTALAARFESRVEEGFLSTAVRFGF